jgi:hypothetical protein
LKAEVAPESQDDGKMTELLLEKFSEVQAGPEI